MDFSSKSSFKPYKVKNTVNSFQPFFSQITQQCQSTNYSLESQFFQSMAFVNINNFLKASENYEIFTTSHSFNQQKKEKQQFQLVQMLIQSQIHNNLPPQKSRQNIEQQRENKQQKQQQEQSFLIVKEEQNQQKYSQVQFHQGQIQKQKIQHKYRHPHLKRPFICNICEKGLTSQTILNHHISEKHGEKKWRCPTCTYVAASKLRLMRHSCKIQGEQCPLCKKRNIDMNKHNYNIHKPQTCSTCGQQFIGYNELRKHDLENHRVDKSSKKSKLNDKY